MAELIPVACNAYAVVGESNGSNSHSLAAAYRQALVLAEALGMRPLQAHCHRGLGRLYAATGQPEPTRMALSMALEMYRAMDMTFWLPQTEAALAQVDA
jgi:hypothetical protein